ncbi:hypothetical protein [Pandoraea sp. PE-S2T-3]|uniref:hypothetical protein n=1 Tax=Pandoraea sp. PE-S2T-3 TaxID=1986993 RepID=UPI0020CFCD7F|nr:hypothetical protein [Pandoraea sp. PE-S2T-3]
MKKLFLLLAAMVFASSALAQVQQARGKATVTYEGWSISREDKARALSAAQLKAVEFYYADAGEAESENFDAIRQKILSDPDRYILDSTILAEDENSDKKQYTVAVRVSLNVANLRNAVKANSAVAKGGVAGRSPLAFIFVSREVESSRAYDDRVYKRVDGKVDVKGQSNYSEKGVEGESIRGGQIGTSASTSAQMSGSMQRSVSVETGGSRTRRATDSTFRLIPSANLSQVFTSTFAKAGFKVNEAALIEPYTGGQFKVANVENDYQSGMDLKPATLASMVAGMRVAHMAYIALGTLDVGLADRDPNSGLMRVAVTVNAKLLDIGQTIPDTIASVGPVQYAGTGPTEAEARNNALRLAANNAARELTSQITNLSLR